MSIKLLAATAAAAAVAGPMTIILGAEARLPDRSRVAKARGSRRDKNGLAIEGAAYRLGRGDKTDELSLNRNAEGNRRLVPRREKAVGGKRVKESDIGDSRRSVLAEDIPAAAFEEGPVLTGDVKMLRGRRDEEGESTGDRRLSSQLTGCCYTYQGQSAADMCDLYGEDCVSGETPSHDSGDSSCEQEGLSFIGISFSVNTANGNPYSYQLCDQFPMENIIDRNYDYVMSMDEDGWLVGAGYKSFDYSGKMPYIDSSHTELLRVGSLDVDKGGTTIEQVYEAMDSVSFPPFSIFPEYLKGGGGHHSGDDDDEDNGVPSCDITLIVSIVETYEDGSSYSAYDLFIEDLFAAMEAVNGGPCMDDGDTDPHVSMSRGVKFKSSWHQEQYIYNANLEVAVWQAMYPKGTPIGAKGYASFPPGNSGQKQYVGYGNLYFFFDRANITQAFHPNRDLTDDESYYAKLYMSSDTSEYYAETTEIGFDYSGSQDGGNDYEHNPYSWKATMAMHDMTDGWDLPPNCEQEGETFFGIPLSRKSDSNLQASSTFQSQFDFENIIDRNYTYIKSFGTNHGWLVGEQLGNGAGSIVDKDTAHIPIFYTGTTNPDMGGISLSNLIKVGKRIDFGTLYIKPAFVFIDDSGHVKLQFEMDPSSALAYLYDNLCKELGIAWNYDTPSNNEGVYTNCAMHASGDRAKYGCGPEGTNAGGFCPQMTVAYSPKFEDEDSAAAYLNKCNNYVDYWRSLYPSGAAVGTDSFCPSGGCLALFLNRYDVFNVFKPDLAGSWIEYNGGSQMPTFSPAPTWHGGCDDPHNAHLDRCFRKRTKPKAMAVVWDSLGTVGQFSVLLVAFMAATLSISIFLARARKRKRKGESYFNFFLRDTRRSKKKRKKKRRVARGGNKDLEETMLNDDNKSRTSRRSRSNSRSRSKSASGRSKSKSGRSISSRSKSRSESKTRTRTRSKSQTREKEGRTRKEKAEDATSPRTPRSPRSQRSPRNKGEKKGDGEFDDSAGSPRQQLV